MFQVLDKCSLCLIRHIFIRERCTGQVTGTGGRDTELHPERQRMPQQADEIYGKDQEFVRWGLAVGVGCRDSFREKSWILKRLNEMKECS